MNINNVNINNNNNLNDEKNIKTPKNKDILEMDIEENNIQHFFITINKKIYFYITIY
jgi:hypothetical protein